MHDHSNGIGFGEGSRYSMLDTKSAEADDGRFGRSYFAQQLRTHNGPTRPYHLTHVLRFRKVVD